MLNINGYTVTEKIYDGSKVILYKGMKDGNNQAVAFKVLKNDYPDINEINAFEQEFAIMKKITGMGIVKPIALEKHKNTPIIVMEYIEGSSLRNAFETKKPALKDFLDMAIRIVERLAYIHDNNIIHKDINLSNIMWNSNTQEITIIDFGISTELTKENQEIVYPDKLEGTLAYISPEQTGRMNRSIDYRTDYYSLGVSFYKMLTGIFPFVSPDPVELVHAHIARAPVPPFEIDATIPDMVSQIIMKLLEKTAEKRYQSSRGLLDDLNQCRKQLIENNIIKDFELCRSDISHKFQIPEKLYGRENEITSLMNIFERVSNGAKETVFVPGISGIGKSALIHEINKPVVRKRGSFISGKFDQFKRNLPYTAIIEAFSELLKQLLTEKKEKLEIWKKELLGVLKDKGKVIIDVLPELELIIGPQQPVEPLPPVESQNRFNMLFLDFIKVFTRPDHPLVLFIDDLQWADLAGLNLLKLLITTNDIKYFLFIGAYRDNEVTLGHPFATMLENIEKEAVVLHKIKLSPLKIENINRMLSETLLSDEEQTLPISRLVLEKTGGNPFFVKAFIQSLYEKDLILFDDKWIWDSGKIGQTQMTDNVIELMADKVNLLNPETLKIIKLACCIGVQTDISVLSSVYGKPESDTYNDLKEALNEGLILKVENMIKFVHDKIHEATYSIITNDEQSQLHYQIGKTLLRYQQEDAGKLNPFSVVNQLNAAHQLLAEDEKSQVVDLNFEAGQRAKDSSAFTSSTLFFRKGAELLPDDIWENDYKKALDYYTEWAEAEFLAAHSAEAEKLFAVVKEHGKSVVDKGKVIICEIDHNINGMKFLEAIDFGIDCLNELGISFPAEIEPAIYMQYLEEINTLVADRDIDELLHIPQMKEEKYFLILNVLSHIANAAYIANHPLMPVFVMESTKISLVHGNHPISSIVYVYFAILKEVMEKNYQEAYKFAELGMKLAEIYQSKLLLGTTYHMFSWFVHWKKHLSISLDILNKSMGYSLESGDNQRAGYAIMCCCFNQFLLGENLESLNKYFTQYLPLIDKLDQPLSKAYIQIWQCGVLNLSGKSTNKLILRTDNFDEDVIIKVYEQTNDVIGKSHIGLVKLILSYFFEEYTEALKQAEFTELNGNGLVAQTTEKTFYFMYALTLAKVIDTADDAGKTGYMEKLHQLSELYKTYASQSPGNYDHKYNLILAEIARLEEKEMKEVTDLYNKAIDGAQENEYLHEEAIANECAARYYLSIGLDNIARLYIREAFYCYQRWGAGPKIALLEKEYPELLPKNVVKTQFSTTSSSTLVEALDLHSILKAAQVLSGEIDLGKLLEKMIKYVIENAGAQKGYFILPTGNSWLIQAEGSPDGLKVQQAIPVERDDNKMVSPAIIHYVQNSRENVVLDDAANDSKFSHDPYVKVHNLKSVLCMPLVNKNEIIAILYLENNLSTGVFTEDRLEVLKLLSAQMAITIENARMFRDLEELNKNLDIKVKQRTRELQQTIQELQQTQAQLVESEKLAALGQLTAGISHEINTPLGAINSSIESMNEIITTTIPELPPFLKTLADDLYPIFLDLLNAGVNKKRLSAREERKIKKQITAYLHEQGIELNTEVIIKLVSMGIHDTIEHYLPLLQSSQRDSVLDMAYQLSTISHDTKIIQSATTKAAKIAFALKNYTHFDHTGQKVNADIKETVETVLTLYDSKFKQGVDIVRNYSDIPHIACYPDELNQVWTNIVHNAIQAMDNKGTLTIDITGDTDSINVSFKDTGEGITGDIMDKIFEPFFTTRPLGEGSGLGLSIVKNIVDKHDGKVDVESLPGAGAVFTISLPNNPVSNIEV